MLRNKTASFSGIKSYSIAVSDCDGEATLKIHKDNFDQNSITFSGANFTDRETFMTKNEFPLFQETPFAVVDVLKIDTEGSEAPIMRSLAPSCLRFATYGWRRTAAKTDRRSKPSCQPTHRLQTGTTSRFFEFCFSVAKNNESLPCA